MDDARQAIFSRSDKVISKLQLLSAFFEDELIFNIYIRTQVIHKLFESNPELDINKLDLFRVQFTESIIELLKKIKKNNEKAITVTEAEISLNEELMAKISNSMQLEKDYGDSTQAHVADINQSLLKLYQNLSGLSADIPFPKGIDQFSSKFSRDFFYEVDRKLIDSLIDYEGRPVYKNGYAVIEKKLMGLQCSHSFSNDFYCGLKSANTFIEIYRMVEEPESYFLFYPYKSLFLSVDFSKIKDIDLSEGISKKARIIKDLTAKNAALEKSIDVTKVNIPAEVTALLNTYHEKISGIDFLDFIDDFDVQANILKTMLNTDSI